ncbi:MAG: rhomboid family intramembrane serine protease [Microbacterium sp. SCN 70-200]|uniref:rhomboid family intramembrane serine protease n=1 Tax=unclassified Microbacterium TaxID=2609290 RepID=UPI00086C7DF0|nr:MULTISPECIES: rhomboid family intramembrane serine protease [unclassified Microbacterium]MBN9215123.1 rhomboid family intramembrane serine protease [Microbacterium sp.]ODT42548.1 MAG: rhomboid family intramembrane serine protease [Microbacterium sp. SCN 70-200]OJV80109.1 MAG: rhomboid family intramembrane serine protease [Microbacterium sp. 70-16]
MTDADFRTNPDNYCYRHPDRQSFVLCQRCLRTICPECQTQMPVGVICPECLAEQKGAQQSQRAATVTRMPRRRAAQSDKPLVTYGLVIVTSVFYLIGLIPGVGAAVRSALVFYAPLAYTEPWRLVTVTLVHTSIWHIVLNMLALWALGRSLEPLLGRGRFLTLYLLSALGGSVLTALLAPTSVVAGASGAVWGLLGAMFVIGRHIGANVTAIAVLLGLNLLITFLPGSNIAWQAHIGGGLVGALIGFIFARTRAIRQRRTQIWLLVAVAAGLLALLAVPLLVYR